MKIDLPTGKYVVAVSGGVDSMVLLDILRLRGDDIVVAHFQHGVRSADDELLDLMVIEEYCNEHQLGLRIGSNDDEATDEASLRAARYAFLSNVLEESNYNAVLTAHHEDDVLETAIFNLVRGTKGRGLHSLASGPGLIRPLLHVSKQEIYRYAEQQGLAWREDSTNTDESYSRNYIRKNIIPRLSKDNREELLARISDQSLRQSEIDRLLKDADLGGDSIDRKQFLVLPHTVSMLVMHEFLRSHGLAEASSKITESAVIFAKTAEAKKTMDLAGGLRLLVSGADIRVLKKD